MHKGKALVAIRIAGLPEGAHTFDFTCRARDFRGNGLSETIFTGDIAVKVSVKKNGQGVTALICTTAKADFTCDICLAPLSRELQAEYRIEYGYGGTEEKTEGRETDYRLIDRNRPEIDLTEDVRETLLLSVPMKITCSNNPDCRLYRPESGSQEKNKLPETEGSWRSSLEKLKTKVSSTDIQ